MDKDLKKKLIIAGSIGALILVGFFIKNKLSQKSFKPLSREDVIKVLKKARKQNYTLLKQVCLMATQIGAQMKLSQIDPQMVKSYLQSPQSPFKINQMFEKNYAQACKTVSTTYEHFNDSVDHYITTVKDSQILHLVSESERDYQVSLSGKMPQVKVTLPSNLTVDKLIEIHKQLTLKKYLQQVQVFRVIRGKSQQQLLTNPDLMKDLPNPQVQEQKILEKHGLGANDQPAAAVYTNGLMHFRNDPRLKQSINKTQSNYLKIFNRYKNKLQQNRITQQQLNDLQSQLLYSQFEP